MRLLPAASVTVTTSLNLPEPIPRSALRPRLVSLSVSVLRTPALALPLPLASTDLTDTPWLFSQPRVVDSAVSTAPIEPPSLLLTLTFSPPERSFASVWPFVSPTAALGAVRSIGFGVGLGVGFGSGFGAGSGLGSGSGSGAGGLQDASRTSSASLVTAS